MAAFVTDQFRILNASNFIDSISDSNNSYYAFLGLANPTSVGFGRSSDWNTNTPNPIDNFRYLSHYRDTVLFGKKITESNAVRVVRKIEWIQNSPYDMYRHDYDNNNQAPVSKSYRLYDANYYVITSAFRVYICIDNGSSGTTNPKASIIEPTQTTPNVQYETDGYAWKYLFSVNPSDIIKFDSTEYIPLPNNWETNPDTQVVRESGNPEISNNQIKKVFIKNGGSGYTNGVFRANILGDGVDGQVDITVQNGTITDTQISRGGRNYTYGVIDYSALGSLGFNGAELIPIIPPSIGHGYDIYKELGADKVLLYARFDDSNRDFPVDTQFSQIGVMKNPVGFQTTIVLQSNTFSSLYAAVLTSSPSGLNPGDEMTQNQPSTSSVAKGYVVSFDSDTKVLKYYQDRSLVFGNGSDQSDNPDITNLAPFNSTDSIDIAGQAPAFTVDTTVNNTSIITVGLNQIDTGVQFSSGLANPEINKKTGDILYINNRPVVERSPQQKEDIKIILEF